MESHPGNDPSQPLRIVIVLDSWLVPAWIAQVVKTVSAEFRTQAVLRPGSAVENANSSFLFERYKAWDGRHQLEGPDPLAIVQLPDHEQGPNVAEPDVVLWLSGTVPDKHNQQFCRAKYGIWFYRHGDHDLAGAAAYFSELVEQKPVTSSYLVALLPSKAFVRVAEAHTASELGWSLARQQQTVFWKGSLLPVSALRQMKREWASRPEPSTRGPRAAGNLDVLRFAVRNAARTATRRALYADMESHWFVAYRNKPEQFVANAGKFTAEGWKRLSAPSGHFYADPFVLTRYGRTFLYVEDYLYAERRGVLSVLELLPNGEFGPPQQILNRPYHLSYPFVFEHDGEVYMIPETMEAGRIELYQAMEVPHRWELVKVLQENVAAVDTTLWIEGGRFYFFTNLGRPGIGPNDLLYLFTADSLTGEWRPHPANPISMDVRGARGAGKLFWMGDKLVRPSQDCSVRYGYATQLHQVDLLTPNEYRERPLLRIEPDWAPKLIGTHTINSDGVVEVIDGQVYQTKYRS